MGRLNRRNEGRAAILAALGIAAMASCQRADMSPGRVESTRVRPVVVIDGRFDEWGAARSTQFPAGGSVASVSSLSDSTAVYVALALRESTNLQGSASPLLLVFDADDDPATGVAAFGVPGADLVISFTALTEEGTAQGVVSWVPDPDDPERVTAPSRPFVPADLGLWFEPLHATDRIELRLARGGANGLFATEGFAGRIVVLEGGGAERERSPLFRHRAPAAEALTAEAEPRSGLDRAPEAEFRVLVWNVAGRLSSNPEPFRAILRAIDADLVLLDEVSARTDLAAVRAVLPGDPSEWSVHIGSSGGRQRGAVAARSPLTAARHRSCLLRKLGHLASGPRACSRGRHGESSGAAGCRVRGWIGRRRDPRRRLQPCRLGDSADHGGAGPRHGRRRPRADLRATTGRSVHGNVDRSVHTVSAGPAGLPPAPLLPRTSPGVRLRNRGPRCR